MPITREQLDTFIDTNVTNKTAVNSLTPENEGDSMKKIADYVDEQILSITSAQKTVKITLSSAEILSIFTSPKELVPAVSGKLLVPVFLHQRYIHDSSAYTGGATWRIGLGAINTAFSVVTAVIGSADDSQAIQSFTQNFSTSGTSYDGLNIIIGATSADPTGGDGTLELYLTYLEITI